MNSHIDFRMLPNNVPSLCIPRVFTNWTEARIRGVFDELNMGDIQRIDVLCKTTEKGEKFNRVFIHFKRWFSNPNADMARERLLNGKEIKIMYDEPWFWKVSAYREVKKNEPDQVVRRPRASIIFDDVTHVGDKRIKDIENINHDTQSHVYTSERRAYKHTSKKLMDEHNNAQDIDNSVRKKQDRRDKQPIMTSPSSKKIAIVDEENIVC
jgi:hypothetical protein